MEQTKEKQQIYPKKVKAGYAIIRIASVLMILTSLAFVVVVVLTALSFLFSQEKTNLSVTELIAFFLFMGGIAIFDFLAAIAGFSYASHKTALVQATGAFAFICLFVFLGETVSSIIGMVRGSGNTPLQLVGVTFANLGVLLYFLGWFLSKDYFED